MQKNTTSLFILNTIQQYKKQLSPILRKHLAATTFLSNQEKQSFNDLCIKKLRKAFQNIIKNNSQQQYIEILKTLIQNFFYGYFRQIIKLSLILNFVDDIFQCLSLRSLRQIFQIVDNQMIKIKRIDPADQNSLLRITNSMLKRISRAQDIQFRGRLHISLSRILKLCHDSGLNGKSIALNNIEIDKVQETLSQTQFTESNTNTISYRFYQRFWGLQKYFYDANSLFTQTVVDQNIITFQEAQQIKQKGLKLSLSKLKTIQSIIIETIKIFQNNPLKQSNLNSHQPIKYLTSSSLLLTQLNDSYFRKLFLIQGILFCYCLKNMSSKSSVVISDDEKLLVQQIQKRLRDGLTFQANNLNEHSISIKIEPFLFNERYWIQLKQYWREKKKAFFRKPNIEFKSSIQYLNTNYQTQDQQKRNFYYQLINPNCNKTVQKQSKIFCQIMEKMKIQGIQFLEFIKQQNTQKSNLQRKPLFPSFQYYYTQAVSTLENFESYGNINENFETKNQYTVYEWKALKSLYRQNLKEVSLQKQKKDPNAQKYKQYKLLYIVKKREDQFKQIAKRVKLE